LLVRRVGQLVSPVRRASPELLLGTLGLAGELVVIVVVQAAAAALLGPELLLLLLLGELLASEGAVGVLQWPRPTISHLLALVVRARGDLLQVHLGCVAFVDGRGELRLG